MSNFYCPYTKEICMMQDRKKDNTAQNMYCTFFNPKFLTDDYWKEIREYPKKIMEQCLVRKRLLNFE